MNAPLNKPMVIGITGGMASGKSTLARMFAGRGIAHVDADVLVHRLMRRDRETIAAIAAAFPQAVTPSHDGVRASKWGHDETARGCRHEDGMTIHRASLATHITKHPESLAALEAILHPRVRALEEAAIRFARRNRLRAVVLDVPLLFETGADELCDVVIVAHAPMSQRRARAFKRVGMTEAKWRRLTTRQWPAADKKHLADIVIHTSMGKAATRKRVMQLMAEWGLK